MENLSKETGTRNRGKSIEKGKQPTVRNKPNARRVKTITPDNNSREPVPSAEKSSNVGQGPAVENL